MWNCPEEGYSKFLSNIRNLLLELHRINSLKTVNFIFTNMRTSNFTLEKFFLVHPVKVKTIAR
jgi:hypothetical protein